MKHTCPGIVYSIGLSPASAAAARKSLEILQASPQRVAALKSRSAYFLTLAKQQGFDTAGSSSTPIVPVILGSSFRALKASRLMHQQGISVQPILYPAVPEASARLRFFITALHTLDELSATINALVQVRDQLD